MSLKKRIEKKLIGIPILYNLAKIVYLIPDRLRFHYSMMFKKAYFGNILCARQIRETRGIYMKRLINQEIAKSKKGEFRVLEIGSWAGESAILWAKVCKENKKGKLFCIDTWGACKNSPRDMKKAVNNDKIFKLFLHNIKASGLKNYIIPIRSSSNDFSALLKPAIFDIIYIDGDHSYTQFKKDLINYMSLVKFGGIICGDDLELQSKDISIEYAKLNKEKDIIFDEKAKKHFHPGITLVVGEIFGEVSTTDGFWAMRRIKTGWEKVIIK
jgi:predicted O-methyltransferase YrrM